jgi:hypothetical protein
MDPPTIIKIRSISRTFQKYSFFIGWPADSGGIYMGWPVEPKIETHLILGTLWVTHGWKNTHAHTRTRLGSGRVRVPPTSKNLCPSPSGRVPNGYPIPVPELTSLIMHFFIWGGKEPIEILHLRWGMLLSRSYIILSTNVGYHVIHPILILILIVRLSRLHLCVVMPH